MTAATKSRPRRPRDRARKDALVPANHIITTSKVRKLSGHRGKPVTRHTLIRWREHEQFPEPFRVVDGVELWDAREVRAWLHRREAQAK